ncbi:MAG: hypothetical protein E6K54_09045 [Gammaproteobacteria bacterium]|nr:MAG: hypothetical protein E6K54_09045 [Gammaproteobacteria bacterium]
MTAPIRLNHSTPVQQSLVELTHRANQLNIYVDELKPQLEILIDKIIDELEKEKRQPRKFLPIFDQDKFLQFIQNNLDEFNLSLSRVYFETRQFEHVVKKYHSTINSLSKEEEGSELKQVW